MTSPIRFGGITSGMDTAGMVQQLMRAEGMRMDRLTRRRTLLQWRQDAVRNTMTNMNTFRRENTDFSRPGNINHPSVWNTTRATVTNTNTEGNTNGITVTTTNNARPGTFDVRVAQVAQGDVVMGSGGGINGFARDLDLDMRLSAFTDGPIRTTISGSYYYLEINGEDIRIGANYTIRQFMNAINNSDVDANIRFDNIRGRFILESTRTGEDATIRTGSDSWGILQVMGLDNITDVAEGTVRHGVVTGLPAHGNLTPSSLLSAHIPGFAVGNTITIAGRTMDLRDGETFQSLMNDMNRILAGTLPGQTVADGFGVDTGVRIDMSGDGRFYLRPTRPNTVLTFGDGTNNDVLNFMFGVSNHTTNNNAHTTGVSFALRGDPDPTSAITTPAFTVPTDMSTTLGVVFADMDLPDGWTFALSVGGLVPTPPTLNADSTFQDLLDMIGSNNTIADIYTDADGVSSLRLRSATPGTSMASIATRPDAAGGSLDERSTTLAILNRMAPGITSMVALNQGITAANSVEIPDFSHSPSLYTTLNDEQTVTIAVTRGGTTETFTRTFAADETYDAVMAWVNEIEGASMTFNSALGRFVLTTEGTAGEVSMTAVGFEFMGFSNSVDVNPVSTVRIPGSVTSNPVSVRNPVIADGHLGPNTFLHNFFAPGTVSDITIAGRQISINWGDPNADPPTGDTFFTLLMDANRILAGTMPGQAGYGTDTGVRMDVSANGTFSVFVTDPALVYAHNTNPANPNAPANPHTIQIGDGNDNALINLMFGAHNVTVNTPLEQNGTAIENNPILDRPLGSLRILDITIGEGDDAVTTSLILTAGMTHRQAMAAINAVDGLQMTFDPTTSTFTISGTEANTPFRVEGLDLFGFSNVIESDMTDGSRHVRTAQDAVLYYDVGQSGLPSERIVQSSNTFEIHGMRINLTNAVEVGATFTINNERNVDDTFDAIMEFVEQYNNLIRMLDAIHSTPRPRAGNAINGSFFEPLTDEQRAAMSDREIERWEEQARIGLLHRDSDIRHIQQQLRSAMMAPVVLAQETDQFGNVRVTDQIFLFQIGITTVGRDGPPGDQLIGVLRVDEDRLREALENDPERVERLFSDTGMNVNGGSPPRWGTAQERRERAPIVGLGFRLDDVLNNAAEYRDGSLQRRAGYHSGLNVTENMMTRQIRDYDRRISAMQQFLIRRENHFFAMFARMEQAMAQSHAQMDSLFAFMTQ